MTKAAHTPGPWSAQAADNRIWTIHDAHGRHFANVRPVRDYEPKGEAAANAALIAEAPALKKALGALVRQIVETSAYDDAKAGEDPGLLADVENASAILARIEGGGHG